LEIVLACRLKELGWRLEKDKNGKVKGFQPPKEDA
jgi:hypothetical protein